MVSLYSFLLWATGKKKRMKRYKVAGNIASRGQNALHPVNHLVMLIPLSSGCNIMHANALPLHSEETQMPEDMLLPNN